MKRLRFLRAVAIVAVLTTSTLAALVAAPPSQAAVDPTTLLVANNYNPTTFDPAIAYDQVGPAVFRSTYEQLVRLKGASTSQYEGVLATHWTANAAKTIWTFSLRKGVMFHDGTPFTAEAVRFSINRTLAINQAASFIMGQFMDTHSVRVLDPYTVQFHLNVPAPRLLAAMASQWGNWVVSPAAIKAHTIKKDLGQAWLATHDAGSGPYTISQYLPNQSITLVKFPGYWRGWAGHHVDRVVMTFVTQEATRRGLIEKGDIDLTLTFSPQNLRAMQQNPRLKVDLSPGVLQEELVPTVSGPFASVAARQALAYAFDYNAMNTSFLKGFAVQAQGPIAHGIYGHNLALPLYRTDLAKARRLFAAAGVKPGTTVTAWYIADDTIARQIALITQGQLAQLGISVKLTGYDTAAFQNAQGGNEPIARRPNLWVSNWFPDYSDPIDVITPLYHSRTGASGAVNMGLYHNAEVDRLLAQAAVTADPAKQQKLFDRLQYILTWSDPAAVYISDTAYQSVYRTTVHGFVVNPTYGNTFEYYPLWKS
ncbi:MAG: ABC transporter substrate-binding protein [Chloroflexota bacterium]